MINLTTFTATIPVSDLKKSADFFESKLGLKRSPMATPPDGVLYESSDKTYLYLYERPPSHADHTLASFGVTNLEVAVAELTQKGVSFEHYDLPHLKTDSKGIMTMGTAKAAWFKDPDGNIFSILQLS